MHSIRLEFSSGEQAVFAISVSGEKGKKISVHLSGYLETMLYDDDGISVDGDDDGDDDDDDDDEGDGDLEDDDEDDEVQVWPESPFLSPAASHLADSARAHAPAPVCRRWQEEAAGAPQEGRRRRRGAHHPRRPQARVRRAQEARPRRRQGTRDEQAAARHPGSAQPARALISQATETRSERQARGCSAAGSCLAAARPGPIGLEGPAGRMRRRTRARRGRRPLLPNPRGRAEQAPPRSGACPRPASGQSALEPRPAPPPPPPACP